MSRFSLSGSRDVLVGAVAILLCAGGLHFFQQSASRKYEELGRESDIYALPRQEHLMVMSLGFHAATADLLFGRTMVAAGIHFAEHREFEHLEAYLKAILALEPRYRDVYMHADTLLNLSTIELPKKNLRAARSILEKGLSHFPDDADLWMNAGLFAAYMAPPRLPENEDVSEWKKVGAEWIQHACAVWPNSIPMPHSCFSSSQLFEKVGETEAAIQSLERLLAITDDAEIRAGILSRLAIHTNERTAKQRSAAIERLSLLHMGDLPMTSRTGYQLIGPAADEQNCAGLRGVSLRPECATSFDRWREAAIEHGE